MSTDISEMKRRQRRREAFRQATIHLVLLVGCVVFAFPFVWLVSTSFKDDREISVFPPQWVPKVPHHTLRSPFVDPAWFEEMKRPASMDADAWGAHQDAIARAVDDSLAQAYAAHPEALPDPKLMDDPAWKRAMRNGMWAELSRVLPDEVAKEPARVSGFIAAGVDAGRLRKVATGASRLMAVGHFDLRTPRNDLLPLTASEWRVASGSASVGAPVAVESESGPLVRYDLSGGPLVLERVLRPRSVGDAETRRHGDAEAGAPGSPSPTPPLLHSPDPSLSDLPETVESITLGLRSDASWHRVYLDVETADAVYRSQDAAWMERSTWQDMVWRFKAPEDRTLPVVVLRRDASAKTTVTTPGELKMRLRVEPSGKWLAAYAKYSLNYRRALMFIPFWRFVGNSLYLVVLNVIGQLFACSLVAYAFARLRFYGRDALFAILLATMMLPHQVTMIPVFLIFKGLGWYDTLKPLWVGSFFGSAFFIFLLRQFFMTIPQDLEDAAKIDGCGFFGTYWRILLPLVRPALATVAIFTFMGTWNEFMGPLIYIGSQNLTPLSLGLFMFRSEHGGEWGMMMAASTLMTLPVVVIFFFAQRYFIQGVTLTGMGGK